MNDAAPVLIVGGFGQVGERLRRRLANRATVTSTRDLPGTVRFDLEVASKDPRSADDLLAERDYAAVLCVGAFTNVDGCEDDERRAMIVNAHGPAVLAKAAVSRSIPFVYFSSDYVFDGRSGPYGEEDVPAPICAYGRSKLAGEHMVLEADPSALIIRTTVVYGPDAGRKNFVYTLARLLREGRGIRTPDDQVSTPTYNEDLAAATLDLLAMRATGIYHVCGPEMMTRTTFANRAGRTLSLDTAGITGASTADLNQKAPRPLRAGLRIAKLERDLPSLRTRNVEDAIEDWIRTSPATLP